MRPKAFNKAKTAKEAYAAAADLPDITEQVSTLTQLAEMSGFNATSTSPNAKGTIEVLASRDGWLLRTWVFPAAQGSRMVNLTAPEGLALTDEARSRFGTIASKHPGRAVSITGSTMNRVRAWSAALAITHKEDDVRPLTAAERDWRSKVVTKAFGPKRAEVAEMLGRLVLAAQLDCISDEMLEEASALVSACTRPV